MASNNAKILKRKMKFILVLLVFTTLQTGKVKQRNILDLILSSLFPVVLPQNVPQHLIACYRGNNTQPWAGGSLSNLLDLIRKVENAFPNTMDIRTLSANLFHRMKLDGIQKAPGIMETEFLIPYRANGIMTPKFNLLRRLIPETPGRVEFEDVLSAFEICLLHKLISYSVEPFERGNEARTCPLNLMPAVEAPWITGGISLRNDSFYQGRTVKNVKKFGRGVSKCPIEMGVVKTGDYGTISPGTFIAAVAAGLQPQRVQISEFVGAFTEDKYSRLETFDLPNSRASFQRLLRNLNTIDNKYAAGLSGDLAEVCLYQTPYVKTNFAIGVTGSWNDTHFPRLRYLEENHQARWELSEPEILAGLDGLFISQQVSNWVSRVRRLRLSQIMDMYYSDRGIPGRAIETSNHKSKSWQGILDDLPDMDFDFTPDEEETAQFSAQDEISSACHRDKILNSINVGQLKDETYYLAQILQFSSANFYINDELLRRSCDAAVDLFMTQTNIILDKHVKCNQVHRSPREPAADMNLIIDGGRTEYENQALINHVSEIAGMATFGSLLQVIHGTTGEIMANRTNSSTTLFENLQNFTGRCK